MILELRSICKDYIQDKLTIPVLKDVSLNVAEGEYVAIMGPSGSGKTTLMNIIGCLDVPTSGYYRLAGKDMLKKNDNELAAVRRKQIGFVFQSFHLLPRESALENVALPLIYAGIKKDEREKLAAEALQRVGLGERMDFLPTQLSGGQKQRVAIARAMVNHPKVLLADEPTGALDSQSGAQIMELFQQLNDEGVTIVMITHDPNVAAKAKRVMHIIDGQISGPDSPQETESIEDILRAAGAIMVREPMEQPAEETLPDGIMNFDEEPQPEATEIAEENPYGEPQPEAAGAAEENPYGEPQPEATEFAEENPYEEPQPEATEFAEENPYEEPLPDVTAIPEEELLQDLPETDQIPGNVEFPENAEIPQEGGLTDEE